MTIAGAERRQVASDPDWRLTFTVWSLWHFQSTSDDWTQDDDEQPHLLIGCFASREHAEDVRARMRHAPGLRDWPLGFRVGWGRPDQAGAWEQGFAGWWDDDAPRADPCDIFVPPEPTPGDIVSELWDVWHFKLRDPAAPIEPLSAKVIGLFSSQANAAAAVAHRRRQPGFRDWPQGFRIFRRRLGVAFGLDGFQERYGWEAWRDSLRG
jgi:hypothetical protein